MSTAVNNKKRGAPGSSSEQPASKLPALSARAETESSPTRGAPSTAVAPPTAAAALPRGPSRANLNYLADWSALVAKGLENLVSVTFAPDFPVKDEHVTQIVEAAGPKLVELTLGCNNTGNGYCVTDAAVRLVAQRCPNLRTLQLKSCTGITDAAFLAVLSSLTKLQKLACTGNDRVAGKLTDKALQPLLLPKKGKGGGAAGGGGALPALGTLFITDQHGIRFETVEKLIKQRGKVLKIQAGDTEGDSAGWSSYGYATGGIYGNY